MAELRSHGNGTLSQQLRLNPLENIRALEVACHNIALEERPGYDKEGTVHWVPFVHNLHHRRDAHLLTFK